VAGLSEAGLCAESGVIDPGYRSASNVRADVCGLERDRERGLIIAGASSLMNFLFMAGQRWEETDP
jgi:hypothetical protein